MVEFIEFQAQDVDWDNHSSYEMDKVSNDSFIDVEPIFDDVYNCGLPNITRSYEDAIQDSLENNELLHGEPHNYIYDPKELDDIDEIIDNHSNTEKKIEKLKKKTIHIPQSLNPKNSFFE